MTSSDVELEQRIKEIGKQLSHPPDSVEELLTVLDKVEKLLSKVDQSPKRSMIDALRPSMRALIKDGLSKHSDVDVKVAVASCISEITRITAPDAPYDDNQMRDVFKLIVSTFEGLADQSSRSYSKRTSILETASKVRSWVVMLDLECDALIVEMFEHFLKSVRDYHLDSVFPSMGSIMVLVIEESEEIPVEMLKPLLARVKNDNTDVLPIARNLSERVLVKSAERLKPYLLPAVTALGESLDTYTKVVTAVCKGTTATKGVLLYGPPGTGKTILAKANLKLFFIHLTVPNIIASGLAMLKNLISMPKMIADVTLGDQKKRNLLMMLLRDFVMFVQRGTNVVVSWLAFARMIGINAEWQGHQGHIAPLDYVQAIILPSSHLKLDISAPT